MRSRIAPKGWIASGYLQPETPAALELERHRSELSDLRKRATALTQQLAEMRKRYDSAVAHWKKNAVPYNDYQRFGTIFDRNVDWDDKKDLVGKKQAPAEKRPKVRKKKKEK